MWFGSPSAEAQATEPPQTAQSTWPLRTKRRGTSLPRRERSRQRSCRDHFELRPPFPLSCRDALPRYDPTLIYDQASRRMPSDRLRYARGVDREEIRRVAHGETVALDREGLGSAGGRHIEGDGDLLVAAEIALPADEGCSLEHVRVAV